MSASFYDLLKYAATGISSPDMTYYDKMRASTLMGGSVQTLTGIPPLSFKSDGTPLISWSMKGNGSQQGTPTPDNPVMPTFCGVRTANVMPAGENKIVSNNGITFESDGNGRYHIHGTATEYASARFYLVSGFTTPISISKGGQGTLSLFNSQATSAVTFGFYNGGTKVDDWSMTSQDRTSTAYNILGNKYVDSVIITVASGSTVDITITPELTNDGVLPSRFEPYGYKIQISCAGQTTPVYLGQVSTVRRIKKLVLTGQEQIGNYDETYSRFAIVFSDSLILGVRKSPVISSRLIGISDGRGIADVPNNAIYSDAASGNGRWFIKTTDYTTAADFKSFLASEYAAGTPVTIWYVLAEPTTGIVNEPLCKISTYADELSSEDAAVTIPTVKGQNVLTVDTPIQPSEMTITYKG